MQIVHRRLGSDLCLNETGIQGTAVPYKLTSGKPQATSNRSKSHFPLILSMKMVLRVTQENFADTCKIIFIAFAVLCQENFRELFTDRVLQAAVIKIL